jgi:D-alanine-D-alanine ligase
LFRRGYRQCTLLDYSRTLIDLAEAQARANRYAIDFIQGDARRTDLPGDSFDNVIIMGNSLGYIRQPEADIKILAESFRILCFGGWLLVDVADGNAVKDAFSPNSWHEIGEKIVVCRNRELHEDLVKAREMVIDKQKGLIRDRTYAIRLYDSESLKLLLQQSGFQKISVHTDFSPHQSRGDYGFMNNRMIGVGQKK